MLSRILSTIALWAVVLLCIRFLGPVGGIWLVALIAGLTQFEFYGLLRRMGLRPFDRLGLGFGLLIVLAPLYFDPWVDTSEILALAVLAFAVRILGERDPQSRVETLCWTLFGVAYVPFMLHFLVRIILIEGPHHYTGMTLAVWLIAVSKFCDVGALLWGLALGRHKMAPEISPKKTWEGAIGGIFTSAGIGAGIAYFCAPFLPEALTPLVAALLALPIAALAIISDLVESIIKRRADQKDAGSTIPGIGGMFDLSDSLILTAPVAYMAFHLLSA